MYIYIYVYIYIYIFFVSDQRSFAYHIQHQLSLLRCEAFLLYMSRGKREKEREIENIVNYRYTHLDYDLFM